MNCCPHCKEDLEAEVITKVVVDFDDSGENPNEWGSFELVSFSSRHGNYREPTEEFIEEVSKLIDQGLAFKLDCYQHGGVCWSLSGEGHQCRFDTARGGGVLLVTDEEHFKTLEDDKSIAFVKNFIEDFNSWCGGEVFTFDVIKDGEYLDSGGGYCDTESLAGDIVHFLKANDCKRIMIEGDAGGWVDDKLKELLADTDIVVVEG